MAFFTLEASRKHAILITIVIAFPITVIVAISVMLAGIAQK